MGEAFRHGVTTDLKKEPGDCREQRFCRGLQKPELCEKVAPFLGANTLFHLQMRDHP